MTITEWIAVATAAGSATGGVGMLAVRILVSAIRELVAAHKDQTEAQSCTTRELAGLRLEVVALRTRVDTIIDLTPIRSADRARR